MHISKLFTILIALFCLGFYACSDSDEPSENDIIILEGIVRIQDTFEIREGKELVIMPGSEITFSPGAIFIAHGNLTIEGTEDNPIVLIAEDPIEDHRIISAKSGCKIFKLRHTEIIDGLVTSYSTDNHFQYVTFRNTKQLKWDDAAARFWYGKILIEDCFVDWNNQGEGFLLHNVQSPLVQNCTFKKVPDAIEYIHCNNGQILGNHFEGMNDDAVDQNHCFNTLIKDNTFFNVKDKALELGSEKFGSSDSLFVINNLFVGCRVAVNVKESSFARIENATFFNNEISLDIYTDADSTRVSKAEMFRSVVVNSDLPASVNPRSIAILGDCLSDESLPEGTNNLVGDIEFQDPTNNDFTIISNQFPAGLNATSIGYQDPN
ncbi:MAG: right-handed parallel beta-helix repeat-containing protein [Saprospiraceae bacterium]|nr:right-handed parallel beta-helix repeat-containing protein [Saprospiraceae bacterium]